MSETPLRPIGRYELLEVLGEGAMGIVYKARDTFLDRIVALKTYRQAIGSGEDAARRFEREVRAASRLHHPHIVLVYDGGMEEDLPFIAMEWVEGLSLDRALAQRKRFRPDEALPLLTRIADALDYAHRQGVVHRDLKPENILLTPDGQPKIADFSVAKLMSADATVGLAPLGTPTHMAPEQIAGKATDPRADVFALGVIAYQVLTGKNPFAGEHATAVIYNIMNVDPPPPSSVAKLPAAVDAVIASAIEKDPLKRTPDAATFARELRRAFDQPVVAPPSTQLIPRSRPPVDVDRVELGQETVIETPDPAALGVGDFGAFRDLASRAPAPSSTPSLFAIGAVVVAVLGGLLLFARGCPSEGEPDPVAPAVATETPTPERTESRALVPVPTATRRPPPPSTPVPTRTPKPRRPTPTATAEDTPAPRETPTPEPAPTREPPEEPTEAPTFDDVPPVREPDPTVAIPTREPRAAPPPVPPPPPVSLTTIDVIAEPVGAEVWFDGRLAGRTPFRIRDVKPGNHEIEVRSDGYVSYSKDFQAEPKTAYEMSVKLAPVLNALQIYSEPPGAEISVNGVPRGTAPILVAELRNGTYEISARHTSGRVQTRTVELLTGRTDQVTFVFPDTP